mmetsp:Transcript_69048/g.174015  ORF Transcript_69048/g.174015 Transcript_69048/m.174015 type:complete len:221 (+) Transcript_69048:1339-2001(+)
MHAQLTGTLQHELAQHILRELPTVVQPAVVGVPSSEEASVPVSPGQVSAVVELREALQNHRRVARHWDGDPSADVKPGTGANRRGVVELCLFQQPHVIQRSVERMLRAEHRRGDRANVDRCNKCKVVLDNQHQRGGDKLQASTQSPAIAVPVREPQNLPVRLDPALLRVLPHLDRCLDGCLEGVDPLGVATCAVRLDNAGAGAAIAAAAAIPPRQRRRWS